MRGRLGTLVYLAILPLGHAQAWAAGRFRETGNYAYLLVWSPTRMLFEDGAALHKWLVDR